MEVDKPVTVVDMVVLSPGISNNIDPRILVCRWQILSMTLILGLVGLLESHYYFSVFMLLAYND